MIDSQRGAEYRVGYSHLMSNKREWNKCFIKNNQEILLGLELISICPTWYNGSYTMVAEPMKSVEFALYNDPGFNKNLAIYTRLR